MAAKATIDAVDKVVEKGDVDPELIITANIYIHRVVEVKQ
jgi:acyl CoA:acetate/3-ketoacid CoA transferase alpha subunit